MSLLSTPAVEAGDAVALVRAVVPTDGAKGMVVIGLDHEGRARGVGVQPHHGALSFVKVWELSRLLAELDAHALMAVVFRPGPARPPSRHEVGAFLALQARAHRAQVSLVDGVVVRGGRWWSLAGLAAGAAPSRPGRSHL